MKNMDDLLSGLYEATVGYLRGQLPAINRIEQIEEFERIQLVRAETLGDIIIITYDVLCPSLFPAVRSRLAEKDGIEEHNLLSTGPLGSGDCRKEVCVRLGYYGNRLQLCLQCRKEAGDDQATA